MIRALCRMLPSEDPAGRLRSWLKSFVKFVASVGFGLLLFYLWTGWYAGPAAVIINQEEAEGPQYSDPATLDIVTEFHRSKLCPALQQRYKWRWVTYKGARIQDAIPLSFTFLPFFADGDKVMTTLQNPQPLDLDDQWYYRTITLEFCSIIPHLYRSPDRPVNFVGAPSK